MQKKNIKKSTIAIWIIVGGLLLIGLTSPGSSGPDISKAKSYQVLSRGDFSFPGRRRLEWGITSSASSFEERAQTVIKAAAELQKKSGADVVSVWLEINQAMASAGHQLAIAKYAPDGRGFSGDQNWKWEVEAASTDPNPMEVKAGELWYQNRTRFIGRDGAVDEPKLKAFIAKKLGINDTQVTLPWITRQPYNVK